MKIDFLNEFISRRIGPKELQLSANECIRQILGNKVISIDELKIYPFVSELMNSELHEDNEQLYHKAVRIKNILDGAEEYSYELMLKLPRRNIDDVFIRIYDFDKSQDTVDIADTKTAFAVIQKSFPLPDNEHTVEDMIIKKIHNIINDYINYTMRIENVNCLFFDERDYAFSAVMDQILILYGIKPISVRLDYSHGDADISLA